MKICGCFPQILRTVLVPTDGEGPKLGVWKVIIYGEFITRHQSKSDLWKKFTFGDIKEKKETTIRDIAMVYSCEGKVTSSNEFITLRATKQVRFKARLLKGRGILDCRTFILPYSMSMMESFHIYKKISCTFMHILMGPYFFSTFPFAGKFSCFLIYVFYYSHLYISSLWAFLPP